MVVYLGEIGNKVTLVRSWACLGTSGLKKTQQYTNHLSCSCLYLHLNFISEMSEHELPCYQRKKPKKLMGLIIKILS